MSVKMRLTARGLACHAPCEQEARIAPRGPTLSANVRPIITIIACIVATVIANAGEQITANAKGGAANQPTAVELQLLQGTWEGVTVGDPSYQRITITITGNSLHFHRDTNFWFETTITLRPGTEPRQLHATIMDSASGQEDSVGKAVVAIYQIEDGKLTLAALGDGDAETTKSFEAAQDKGLTLYELRKVQPQEKKNTEPPKPQ